jgi:ferredoxin/flavodoxin---NADP+ reductase
LPKESVVSESVLNAIVTQRIEESPGLAVLRIVPDGWVLPEFKPGQFAVLGLPGKARRCLVSDAEEDDAPAPDKLIKRAYSIASSSVAREFLEFYIVLVPSGQLTPRLFALEPGERVWLAPKISGMFTLNDVPADKHVLFVGTGTGLAPYMSMLRTHLVCGSGPRFGVLHGARHSWDLGYRGELMTLQRLCSNFTYIPTISRAADETAPWGGATGYIQDLWKSDPLTPRWGFRPSPGDTHVFLCGNPTMIEDMVELLAADGFREHKPRRPGELHVERYW